MRVGAPGKPRDPFGVALEALRARLGTGRLVAGEPLTITDLAHDLGLSATPVREALSRLAGERLIEDRRGRGYFAPRLDVSDLVELYGLRRLYIAEALAAIEATRPLGLADATGAPSSPSDAGEVLDWIVAKAGNRALFDAYRQVSERLAPSIGVEPQVFALPDELAGLCEALEDRGALIAALDQLHDARRRHAPELMRALRAGENIASL